jgi:hypothetical protein
LFPLQDPEGNLIQLGLFLNGEPEVLGNRLSGENRSLKGTGVNGRDGVVFELLEQGETLGISLRAKPGVASPLYPAFHIPGRLPMPRNINFDQLLKTPFSFSPKIFRSIGGLVTSK